MHENCRLEHAYVLRPPSDRYRDNSKELSNNIKKFESILEDEKKFYTQPLYYHGHIIKRRSPVRDLKPKNNASLEEDYEEQFRLDIERYQNEAKEQPPTNLN